MCSSAQSIDTGRWRMLAKERLVFKIDLRIMGRGSRPINPR
jgi:hypothetical protein